MLLHTLYLIGITAEAMTGALAAGRRRMDTFSVIIIATATALGGSSVRDILLGHYPLGWVKNPEYVIIVATAAVVTTIVAPVMTHHRRLFLVLDALRADCLFYHWRTNRARYGRKASYRHHCRRGNRGVWRRAARYVLQTYSSGLSKRAVRRHLLRGSVLYIALQHYVSNHDVVVISTLLFGFTARMLALRLKLSLPVFHYKHSAH